ncbi:HlyD family efflux transporter periplasmic adaptor subunit [Agrobacterium rhizogenes]|uniref:HlyD family secretion protein n=1 Tax=Rhizobium rhizogenes TaxID=359 RepID=UPI00285AE977|nr:HlyD family efflux transporter periplasmic adaptor subunit [Rhizobium rhizogenes]MDF1889328.1 HlyD family efflux transporter periplasmic adaptor subunit [Rhizobium rhizogenes]
MLFRKEVSLSRNLKWMGDVSAVTRLPVTVAAALGISLILAISLFLALGKYTHRVRLFGVVVPEAGIIRIVAATTGRLTRTDVREGDRVTKGQLLYVVSSDVRTAQGETQAVIREKLFQQKTELDAEIRNKQTIDKKEKDGLLQQHDVLLREIEQVHSQIDTGGEYTKFLKATATSYEDLANRGLILRKEAVDRLENRMRREQEVEALKREAIQLEEKIAVLRVKLNVFDEKSHTEISQLTRQALAIEREVIESEAKREIEIVAPAAGTVTAVLAKPGQIVGAGSQLLTILPEDSRIEIHLFADSRAIGFMRQKSRVMLRFAAYPYQKFGLYPGVVSEFSRVTIKQEDIGVNFERQSENPAENLKQRYQVIVIPERNFIVAYGKNEPIRPGMSVDADIFLDQRPIYQWLLEPIYGFRGALNTPM